MVKYTAKCSENLIRSLFESLTLESAETNHSTTQCKTAFPAKIVLGENSEHADTKVTLTWAKGTKNVTLRTATAAEDAVLESMVAIDGIYHKLVTEGVAEEGPPGSDVAMAVLRNPPYHGHSGGPQVTAGAKSSTASHLPDEPAYISAVNDVYTISEQTLEPWPQHRDFLLAMLILRFGATPNQAPMDDTVFVPSVAAARATPKPSGRRK